LGEVLKRARTHRQLSLRQVEERTGVLNAHLSQIERGQIRRPDPSLLWRLSELYLLDFGLLARWAGYTGEAGDNAAQLAAALRMLSELESSELDEVLSVIDRLRRDRNSRTHGSAPIEP
jgi:transcriptional regulator with XRE-family HTH domain